MRPLLACLLLLNYLLVVGAGLCVQRPGPPLEAVVKPYVHSADCQQQHYLLVDCFEHCNGEQAHGFSFRLKIPSGTGLHFLAQLKGLDVHCVAEALPLPLRPRCFRNRAARPEPLVAAEKTGFAGLDDRPPREG